MTTSRTYRRGGDRCSDARLRCCLDVPPAFSGRGRDSCPGDLRGRAIRLRLAHQALRPAAPGSRILRRSSKGNHGRSRQFHFGIDISAPNGTPVYATLSGTISIHSLHATTVLIAGANGVEFSYWHVVPTVRSGQRAVAYRTVIGHIEEPYGHVHFSESSNRRYLNPPRPGALGPYSDNTRPRATAVRAELDGRRLQSYIAHDGFDLVAAVQDETPLAVPRPGMTSRSCQRSFVGACSTRALVSSSAGGRPWTSERPFPPRRSSTAPGRPAQPRIAFGPRAVPALSRPQPRDGEAATRLVHRPGGSCRYAGERSAGVVPALDLLEWILRRLLARR